MAHSYIHKELAEVITPEGFFDYTVNYRTADSFFHLAEVITPEGFYDYTYINYRTADSFFHQPALQPTPSKESTGLLHEKSEAGENCFAALKYEAFDFSASLQVFG